MRLGLNALFFSVTGILFLSSTYFTTRVTLFKRSLMDRGAAQAIKSGQKVLVMQTIDGDEVVVRDGDSQITVRLLGLYSYDPTASDPLVQPMGRMAYLHLDTLLRNQEVELVFEELKFDSRKRLLAYLHKDGQDVGLQMILKGLSLAYVKYPFSRRNDYLIAEDQAREQALGLWSDPQVLIRSRHLRTVWESERAKGD